MSLDSNQKLTDEQQMLSDMVSKYLSETYDFDSRRKIANGPVSVAPPHWKKFAEMGWLAMPFDVLASADVIWVSAALVGWVWGGWA